MNRGAVATRWHEHSRRGWVQVDAEVIEEALVTIYVNGEELATIMSTPREQDKLALGFLKNERLIQGIEDVEHLHISENGCCVDVWLNHAVSKPERVIITTGCGGGVTFDDPSLGIEPLQDELRISPAVLSRLFNKLQSPVSLYARTRGVHTAGLVDPLRRKLLVTTEDVGRHNTIDKLLGICLLEGIETRSRVLLATGRISSEMLRKGALMGCPVIASRNSPTSLSVEIAEAWNITLIGYVRRGSMRVYTHPQRVGFEEPATLPVAGD
jgi:FdhD protein